MNKHYLVGVYHDAGHGRLVPRQIFHKTKKGDKKMHNKIHHYNVCYKWADSPYRMHTISNRAMFAGINAKEAILSHFPGLNLQPVVGRRNQLADIDSGLIFIYRRHDKCGKGE